MTISGSTGHAPVLRNLPSRLLGQTATLVSKVAAQALDKLGSDRRRFSVLATLDAFGQASQAALGRRTDLDRSDMNAVVSALAAQGFVTRAVDPDNRRQNVVSLTAAGKRAFAIQNSHLRQAQAEALAPLTAADRQELMRLLRLVHDNLAGRGVG